jgi:hypothetical protein
MIYELEEMVAVLLILIEGSNPLAPSLIGFINFGFDISRFCKGK